MKWVIHACLDAIESWCHNNEEDSSEEGEDCEAYVIRSTICTRVFKGNDSKRVFMVVPHL